MDRWNGIVRVALNPRSQFSVAASVSLSASSKSLTVPAANAIFFTGDRVEGTGNPVIERLSDNQNIAQILVSKFSKLGVCINAWVVEASTFSGPFAVYKEFIPCVNSWGEPTSYNPDGFPASTSTVTLLSKCLDEVRKVVTGRGQERPQTKVSISSPHQPKNILFGFSKGGIVLNQLVAELANTKLETHLSLPHATVPAVRESNSEKWEETQIIPNSKESLLFNISEIHYVDVGLNSAGAYLTDDSVIENFAESVSYRASEIRFTLHGTPRQWCDSRRPWIRNEKDRLLQLLENANQKTAGRIKVILARVKLGKRALAMEGIMAMILDTLRCVYIHTALSIIKILSGDQAIGSQLKEDLEKEKKINFELQDKVTKLEGNKSYGEQ